MHIVVCIKQVIDPEIPPRDFRISEHYKQQEQGTAKRVIGPFDENALEVAIQLKEKAPDITISVLTLDGESAIEALRRALAMGCDDAFHGMDSRFEDLDSYSLACSLNHAINSIEKEKGKVDLILCGREAGDWDSGQVGQILSELRQLPCIVYGSRIRLISTHQFHVEREVEDGIEVLECPTPALITITNNDTNQPRLPKVKNIMMAHRKPIVTLSGAELGLEEQDQAKIQIKSLFIPAHENNVEWISGDSDTEKGQNLATRLFELKIL